MKNRHHARSYKVCWKQTPKATLWNIFFPRVVLDQGSQTCGTLDASVRSATNSKKLEILIKFNLIWDLLLEFCGTQRLFFHQNAEHFVFGMWPSDQFEFETLVLDQCCPTKMLLSPHSPLVATEPLLPPQLREICYKIPIINQPYLNNL